MITNKIYQTINLCIKIPETIGQFTLNLLAKLPLAKRFSFSSATTSLPLYRRKKFMIAFGFLVLAAPTILFFTLRSAKQIEAAWFNDSWAYRKKIPLTNNTTEETNVYINFTGASALDTSDSTKFQTDCGDLRFTKENGELLPFYPVSGCGTDTTIIHVNFNTFSAGSQTIYIYYGNPSVENGFNSSDFSTEAANYTIGSLTSEENSPGPIAHWKFDEGYGTAANDSTPNSNNGTIFSETTSWASEDQCLSGKCIYVNGTASAWNTVRVDDDPALDGMDSLSVSVWVKITEAKLQQIVYKRNSSDTPAWSSYRLEIGSDNKPLFRVTNSSSSQITAASDSAIELNQWYHLVGVYNGSNMQIYINGLASIASPPSQTGSVVNTNYRLMIGGLDSANITHGFIDDVKIYPYARSADQIKSDYASRGSSQGVSASIGGQDPNTSLSQGLVAYWKMDESSWNGTANEVIDSSGNENHGVGVGATAPPTTGVGKYGNGGSFDGIDDKVTIADNDSLHFGTNDFSVSLWMKPTSDMTNYDVIFSKSNSINHYDYVNSFFVAYGELRWYVNDSSQTLWNNWVAFGVPATFTNTWNHVVFVRKANTITGFLNGQLIDSSDIPANYNLTSTQSIDLGKDSGIGTYFEGLIDEARIYNRALSPAEVRTLYNYAPGPIAEWKMDEKTGGYAYDTSGNGYTETLTDMEESDWVQGKIGSALSFGNDEYMRNSSINLGSDPIFTVEGWFKKTGNMSGTGAWGIGAGGSSLRTISSWNNVGENIGIDLWGTATFYVNYIYPLNEWVHITWVKKAPLFSTSTIEIYVNGAIKPLLVQRGSSHTPNLTSGVTIGAIYPSSTYNPSVIVDDFRIYNYARTPGQIVEDMNANHPIGGSPIASQLAYYKFDEGHGTTANNSGFAGTAINGNLGTGTSAPSWSNSGKFGKALNFDGGDVMTIPNDNSLKTSYVTFSAWINVTGDGSTGYNGIVERIGGTTVGNENRLLVVNASNLLLMQFNGLTDFYSNSPISRNTWHHVTYTYDGHNQKIYIDGKLDNTQANEGGTISTGTESIFIGRGSLTSNVYHFNGLIDEVKIYNTALTEDQIKLDYNQNASMVMGALSTAADGTTADNSTSRSYCVPGDTATCNPPVAEWKMDEGTGITLQESASNTYPATITASTWASGCKFGKCLSLNGTSDYAATSSKVVFSGDFTNEIWFKTNTSQTKVILGNRGGGVVSSGFSMYASGGNLAAAYANGTTAATALSSAQTYNDNKWHHLALVVQRTSTQLNSLYYDGKLIASNTGTVSGNIGNNLNLGFGAYADGSFPFLGQLDHSRLYNYARTPAQIAWDYNRGEPIAHWKLDECQGTTAYDSSGNSNHGTITAGDTSGGNDSVGTCSSGAGDEMWSNGTSGKRNASLDFDGTNDYVTADTVTSQVAGSNNTVSAWIKTTDSASWFLSYNTSAGGNNLLYGISSNTLTFYDGSSHVGIKTINDGNWHHVVGILDDVNNLVTTYIDGALDQSTASSATIAATDKFSIGQEWDSTTPSDFLNGQIDDIKIFNYALTPQQVKTEYNSGALFFGPTSGNP